MSDSSNLKYLVTFTAAVILPGAQAALTGFSVGLIAGSMAVYFESDKPLVVAALAGGVAFGLAWLAGLAWWRSRVAGKVRDPEPAQVYPATATRVEVVASDPSGAFLAGVWADLPVDLARLIRLARRVEDGASFSHADLAGPHKPLSRSEFEALRGEFIARGLAVWVNPGCHNQGCELTRAGGAVIRKLADLPATPPTTQRVKVLPGKLTGARDLHTHTGAHRILELGG